MAKNKSDFKNRDVTTQVVSRSVKLKGTFFMLQTPGRVILHLSCRWRQRTAGIVSTTPAERTAVVTI